MKRRLVLDDVGKARQRFFEDVVVDIVVDEGDFAEEHGAMSRLEPVEHAGIEDDALAGQELNRRLLLERHRLFVYEDLRTTLADIAVYVSRGQVDLEGAAAPVDDVLGLHIVRVGRAGLPCSEIERLLAIEPAATGWKQRLVAVSDGEERDAEAGKIARTEVGHVPA